MRRAVFLGSFLGWVVLLTGCAGGNFTLLSGPTALQVSAASATVRAEDSLQISATGANGARPSLRWSVNGIPGGNGTFGTIDASGRYTAPTSLPANNLVTIVAENGESRGELVITLLNPIPVIRSVASRDLGDSVELTINGNRFVTGARVNFGGTIYPGSVSSASQVTTTVPAAAASAAGIEMAVANPEPGAAFSESLSLTISRTTRPSRGSASNAAARFLKHASFGPTAQEVAAINALRTNLGTMTQALNQYIDNQMNPAVTTPSTWPDPTPIPSLNGNNTNFLCGQAMNCVQIAWFQNALLGPDQLRQRTAFALSQIWVISGNVLPQPADWFVPYYRILNDRAFGNYYDIMKDVTLIAAMGYYLDMGNSAKAAPGAIANENYARELLQLFTIGLYKLNEDGTFQLDESGQRIPAYTEEEVQEFARAFTGWTYARNDNGVNFGQSFTAGSTNRKVPMIPVASQHDTGAKTLLNYPGAVSPTLQAGNTAQQDLDGALQNVFNSPNLPPFICQQLIQHLVTSNPSPAYVQRVVNVFKNNGSGVRGDMAAVIKAILMDDEARRADTYSVQNSDGHLKEPVLYIVGILRSLGFTQNNPALYTNNSVTNPVTMTNLGANLWIRGRDMGQNVLFSPSVFNYFAPDYTIQNGTLLGPEFQLQTTANAPQRLNFADLVSRNGVGNAIDVSASLNSLSSIAGNPQQLVDQLEQQFMYGQMSPAMKQTIVNTITPLSTTYRARVALYLVISSSQYQVVK